MSSSPSLDTLNSFAMPLAEHPMRWVFEDDAPLPEPWQDQVVALEPQAAQYLWDLDFTLRFEPRLSAFRHQHRFDHYFASDDEVKKWLYQRGIPFARWVIWSVHPDSAFLLTWKMVIKFSSVIFFANDQTIWDSTHEWMLEFHHDYVFTFYDNRG